MDLILLLVALLGHLSLCVAAINRLHAVGLRRRLLKRFTAALLVSMAAAAPALVAWWLLSDGRPLGALRDALPQLGAIAALAWLIICWLAAAVSLTKWCYRHYLHRPTPLVRYHRTEVIDFRAAPMPAEESPHHFLVHLPRNEILRLDLTERAIDVPRLPAALEGLSIVHMSDFHFTGRIARPYFDEVVRQSNALEPDLVMLTGDLVDKSAYIDWIPETLGRLRARHGVYFVLGNHDAEADTPRLLNVLGDSGLVHLGGRSLEIDVRGRRVLLAGNELPWFGKTPELPDEVTQAGDPLRIFLSHSPDQLGWARRVGADLLLAGHTHGGQIHLPLVGAIFSPSLQGLTYLSGVFYASPTILHVTRGVSGEVPVRLNCPPEMVHLRLHACGV